MNTSRRTRIMRLVRAAITAFVLLLLAVVSLGWIWTGSHQPPPLRTASHVVLSIAAFAGIFALARIWRPERS
jgi:membrane protein YdbS with pleckstrin-like domain